MAKQKMIAELTLKDGRAISLHQDQIGKLIKEIRPDGYLVIEDREKKFLAIVHVDELCEVTNYERA